MRKLLLSKVSVVQNVQMNNIVQRGVLLLQEKNANRYLVLWIGIPEINSISSEIIGTKFDRPMTHDLCISFIQEFGASVDHVVINDFQDDVYYAKIILRVGQEIKEIDARPSDAVAIALRSNVDIFAEESLLDRVAITEKEALEKIQGKRDGGEAPSITEEELETLRPFREVVDGLKDIDRLGSDDPDGLQPP